MFAIYIYYHLEIGVLLKLPSMLVLGTNTYKCIRVLVELPESLGSHLKEGSATVSD